MITGRRSGAAPRRRWTLVVAGLGAVLTVVPLGAELAVRADTTSGAAASTGGTEATAVGSAAAPSGRTRITPEQFGANGSDTGDDTAALQRALDALTPTTYLDIPAGKTYRHNAVLRVTRKGSWIHGAGTVLATNQEQAAIFADAPDTTVDGGLTIGLTRWTTRHDNWETFGLRSRNTTGLTMRDVTMSELELYLNHSAGFSLSRIRIKHSQADGLHLTGGSHDGTVSDVTTSDTGDDGVAVVSYQQDGAPCDHITITRARVLGTTWGRGISVIGGRHITYRDAYVERTSAAGIIVAAESSYATFAPRHVRILGATVRQANQGAPVHGAVVVNSDRTDGALGGQPIKDVLISDVTIQDTTMSKGYNVRVNSEDGASLHTVTLKNIHVNGGPTTQLITDQHADQLAVSGWTLNGHSYPIRL
jgi:hypothetical protein